MYCKLSYFKDHCIAGILTEILRRELNGTLLFKQLKKNSKTATD
jgi:hypothetical protein